MHRMTSVGSSTGVIATLMACACLYLTDFSRAHAFPAGDIEPFASVPAIPGFPEGVAVHGNLVYVSGPAHFATAGTGPSAIQVYDRKTGQHLSTISVAGELLALPHALSNLAIDDDGRMYALSLQLGLIRFTKQGRTYVQESYGAPLPDLPRCADAPPGSICSPTTLDLPPLANDIVFDAAGFAYVTDSFQATIFRYPPGGGAPQVWFQSPLFEGGGNIPFGPNGIRLDPTREQVYVVMSTSLPNAARGALYRLPLVATPRQADLELVREYFFDGPDQLAFGSRGEIYVSLALSNQISVLAPDGTERRRLQSAPDDAIPLDAPAALAFNAKTQSLLIVNHALFSPNPAPHFAVLQVSVDDAGDPLEEPTLP